MSSGAVMDYSIPGIERLIADLEGFAAVRDRHLLRAMKQATITIQSAIVPLVPVGVTARLKNSIGSEVTAEGVGSIIGRVGSSLQGEVYPAVMESGRAPGHGISEEGMERLTRWVRVKRIAGVYNIATHRRRGGQKRQANEDRAVAEAIARAIYRRGIKGRFFMKTGFEKSKGAVDRYFVNALDAIVKELANG